MRERAREREGRDVRTHLKPCWAALREGRTRGGTEEEAPQILESSKWNISYMACVGGENWVGAVPSGNVSSNGTRVSIMFIV